ncbi:unnamed protein product [Blepharisma stoltei]|uniref:C2 PI3K-type domain-containing protein n=1 Tax=Blepharisma stoltei TaxID=1481888 RepID=A0AAU9IPK8_9CILI|nr:unnamed protein product [Blepharisma stoltei]
MSREVPYLLLECKNCKMKYETQEQLRNHQAKFCKDSDYGDLNKLQRKMEDAKRDANSINLYESLHMEDVKKFLKGENKAQNQEGVGSATLGQLRDQIRTNEKEFEKAANQFLSKREEDLKGGLEQLRAEKVEIRSKRRQEEGALLDLMKELEEKREREVRAKAEKDAISQALKDLDKKKLNALEVEKKRELNKLEDERESLRLKEEELMQEVERLQNRMDDNEVQWKQERDKINLNARAANVGVNMEILQKRQMELAKERGEQVAQIKQKKDALEFERQRIMDDLNRIKKGEINTMRKNSAGKLAASQIVGSPLVPIKFAERRAIPQNALQMSEKWNDDLERLEKLKKNHQNFIQNETMFKNPEPTETPKSRQGMQFPSKVDEMINEAEARMNPKERVRYYGQIQNDLNNKDPFRYTPDQSQRASREARDFPNSNLVQPTIQFANPPKASIPNFGNNELTGQNPNLNINPNNNYQPRLISEFEQLRKQQPHSYQPPYQSPPVGYSPPYVQPFQDPTPQPPIPAEDPGVKSLKKELKKLKKKLNNKGRDEFYQGMQDAIGSFQNRLSALDNPQSNLNSEVKPAEMLPEERALNNVLRQEQSDLKLLSALPKDSDLYQAKLEHYKEMSQIRMKMEAMLQELTMQRMKKNFDLEMELEERKLQNERWAEEQKRGLIAAKIQGNLTQNKPIAADYSPETGFFICWDYAVGIPRRYKECQIAYGLYERGEVRLEPRLVPPVKVEDDPFSEFTGRAIFRTEQDIARVPPFPLINLIIELQVVSPTMDGPKVGNFGWTVLDIFTHQRKLIEGLWKIPIYRPPTDSAIELRDIRSLVPMPNTFVFIRIVQTGTNSPLMNIPVVPEETMNRYRIPQSHLRDNPMSNNGYLQQPTGYQPMPIKSSSQLPDPTQDIQNYPSNPTEMIPQSSPLASKGLAIKLESLVGFLSRSVLKFQITIQEGERIVVDKNGKNCRWISDPINTLDTDVIGRLSSNRQSGNRSVAMTPADERSRLASGSRGNMNLTINKETVFINDFYSIVQKTDWNEDLYLIIEILERSSQRLTTAELQRKNSLDLEAYFAVGWTVFQLTNPDLRTLNYGTVELNIYEPPVAVPIYDPQQLRQKDGALKLTVAEPSSIWSPDHRRNSSNRVNPQRLEAFLENLAPQFDDSKYFEKGDGVDFYVDGARFLPDSTSCTKIVVKGFTSQLDKVGIPVGGLPDLNSSVFSPIFGFRTEFRLQTFDPTTTIVVSILTLDAITNEVRVLGYSAINLFLKKFRKDQPDNPTEQDFILNKGLFQLPIYCQEPYRKPPFGLQSFTKMEIIPCATLLVRIRDAPKSENGLRVLSVKDVLASEWYLRGLVIPPPRYEERVYNTSMCMPSVVERYLYDERLRRKDSTVREATIQVQARMGVKLDINDEEMLNWIDQKLQVNPRTPMLDMKYFAKYNPKMGFKIAIDAIHNIPTETPHTVIISLNPPGNLYSTSNISQDVEFNTKLDWNSSIRTPTFLDGFHTYKNVSFNRFLHIIFDVRTINLSKKRPEVIPVGWTILTVFTEDGYIKSGIYQLPLFKGAVPVPILSDLTNNDPWSFIMNAATRQGGPQFLEPVSILVRLVDTQRDGHFATPMELQRLNYQFIPEALLAKFSYNAAAEQRGSQQKRLKSLIPSNQSAENFSKKINEAVANHLGLNHINIA